MLFRSVLASAVAVAALLSTPALAQDAEALKAQVGAYVQPSNSERMNVLVGQLRAAGFNPTIETFEGGGRAGPMQGSNVVVTIGEGAKEILLTAHYDAVKLRDGTMSQGVIDNAGSVVALIEAAKILRDKPLSHRVRVIFFDQEELGLIGAKKWIEAHGVANVAAVVNSDVAAYGDTMMYGQNNGPQSAFVTRATQELCAERALQCVGFPEYPPSDDRAFSAAGAPVVSLGFQDEVGAHQMWLAFNGGKENGLAEGFVPQVFRVIHSKDDAIEAVEGATIATAGATYAALIQKLDAQLR
ncbi:MULTISPECIES: M20/M25/M40 family metallo-hydrolase [unclassified Brevundimonas]|uniref:M20/M25/M40 family metallo-hydrolase n=1 Tax=unclassified Brevundimonas TaxID=2622653 RepID=UPI000CFCBC5E|nr:MULTISPECIES: M20/M25/M40 family metallo-hydrolase [unclassified Brevundimonas]PRA35281.1 Zn-dependent exopeptidase M28 [Brevundimonas sp. MYb27]PQZ82970.1 Zn-dependent exopeptidase M28 [Brevundimonas sp. MYb31]PRB15005.1 Zn-dependent exopeptidase M28 [Brevundimonas sp. MYb52]PRB36892.1 Zn-dependent exopeptidase M28 [Brevundimonas sp. MYb46]PRB52198.1 Zn-dependent exopeptidase M28 [Brevundimonas sp. MYb33]